MPKVFVLNTLYLILLLITGPLQVLAQNAQPKTLTVVPLKDQPSAVVTSIFEDSYGFIWLGTTSGIFRYDGYEFLKYNYDPKDNSSIPPNYVFSCFLEDENGNLWIGSENDLIHFNRATGEFRAYVVDSTQPDTHPHQVITEIMQDDRGVIWTGYMYGGLRKFDINSGTFTTYRQEPENTTSHADYIVALIEDSYGNIWLSSGTGLFNFDREKEEFLPFNPQVKPREWDDDIGVADIFEDRNNFLWFGTNNGLFRYDPEQGSLAFILQNPEDPEDPQTRYIIRIIENPVDSGKSIWALSYSSLSKINLESEKVSRYQYEYSGADRGNIILTIADWIIDRTGRLWLGTDNLGAVTVNLNENRIEQYIPDIDPYSDEDISPVSFYKDRKGYLWVGVRNGALLKYDEQLNLVKQYEEVPAIQYPDASKMFIYSFYEDSQGKLWLSHWNRGLYCFDPESEEFNNYRLEHPLAKISFSRITEVIVDSFGVVWAGSAVSPYYLYGNDQTNQSFVCVSADTLLRDVMVRSVCDDREKNVWFGTQGQGLFCLTPDNRDPFQYINYRHDPLDPQSISSNTLMAVYADNNDDLWIGTNCGLNRFVRESATFYHYNETNGFYADFIFSIQSDQRGNLWLSTEKGLVRFNPNATEGKRFKVLKVEDGLPFDDIYPYRISLLRDGYLYVAGRRGTGNGFMRFHPDSILDNKNIPGIALTGFNVKNEPYKLDSNIRALSHIDLKYNENFFSFEFVALDYKNPEDNQYAYRLVGFDDDFIYPGNRRFANYTGIPPGDYVFRVKGSNNDGYWNEEGVSINISIAPPPWKTWWAYTLYGLIIIIVLYSLRRYDVKRQKLKQELEIEHVEAEKLKELDSMKSRFFANISHEFRTPLTLIIGPLQKLLSKSSDPESKQDLGIMQRNAKRLQNLINQLLELSKLESGKMKLKAQERDVIPLIQGYVQSFESLAKQKGIELVFKAAVAAAETAAVAAAAAAAEEEETAAETAAGTKDLEILAYVDSDKIEKILFNLLSNAFKYTSKGGRIEVQVGSQPPFASLRRTKQSTVDKTSQVTYPISHITSLLISISDTGPGIPAEKLPHIFDRFYQVDDSYTKDQEGSGIGLALTRELVELHHGKIEVESEVGAGATFRVYLPLGREHLKPDQIDSSRQSAVDPPSLRFGGQSSWQSGVGFGDEEFGDEKIGNGMKIGKPGTWNPLSLRYRGQSPEPGTAGEKPIILIVEDNADLRLYIRGYLDPTYRVIEAKDGKRGLERAIEHIPDLIISDVMMPEMDGFELSGKLKTDERTSHIPIILLTARASMESKIEGLETGADDFLTKPFDPQELLVRVRNLIDQRKKLKEKYVKESGADKFFISKKPLGELVSMDEQFLRKVKTIIEKQLSESTFSVEEFASAMNLSRVQLHRKLKALIDLSASDYIRTLRLNKAAELIAHKTANIAEIAYDVGFTNPSHFSESFKKQFGVLPSEFKYTGT